LTSDFAFREAVATGDLATITSALANHGHRIGASTMLFVGLDGKVVADTLASDRVPRPFEFPKLVQGADPGGSMPIGMLAGFGKPPLMQHAAELFARPRNPHAEVLSRYVACC
jgi:hypothetical protein